MRLYLSSFRLGRHPDRLLALAGMARRAAVVCNAMDVSPADIRHQAVQRELASLTELGLQASELDLREPGSVEALADAEFVWVRGGNVFLLRKLLADTGADRLLLELIEQDRVVYAGYSAGACVLGTDLSELARVDDLSAVEQPVLTGLAVLDRPIVPHVDSPDHPETAACTEVAARLARCGLPHWALRDGEVLLVQGTAVQLLS